MPSTTADFVDSELQHAELQTVLQSHLFVRSPTLTHLLSYLCEKVFSGQSDQIKEYSDCVGRFWARGLLRSGQRFHCASRSQPPAEASGRVLQRRRCESPVAHRHSDRTVRAFVRAGVCGSPTATEEGVPSEGPAARQGFGGFKHWWLWTAIAVLVILGVRDTVGARTGATSSWRHLQASVPGSARVETPAGPGAGEEIRILAGSSRNYVDHSGKLWSPDSYFSGGAPDKERCSTSLAHTGFHYLSQQPTGQLPLRYPLATWSLRTAFALRRDLLWS